MRPPASYNHRSFALKKDPSVIPSIQLNEKTPQVVSKVKFLGHIITADLNHGLDINRQRRTRPVISTRAGMISRRFYRCSGPVKRMLFNAFCSNLVRVRFIDPLYPRALDCHKSSIQQRVYTIKKIYFSYRVLAVPANFLPIVE